MIHRKRRLLPLASVLAVVALLAFFTPADAGDQIFQFDIPAEALSQALTEFSQASSQQIIFSEDLTKGLKTSGLHGRYTAEQALDALLSGTDLKAEKNSAGVLMVRPKNVQASESEGAAEVVTDKMNPQNFDKDQHTAQSAALPPLKAAQLEEITVTGSRIPLAAGQQQIQPVRSYTREDIVNSGQSTMGEFLNTLPDVSTITNGPVQTGFAGVQTVQLHGLPIGTTLTLLNGRRLETSSLGFFDLSNIPIAAVERIEIMPTGASAIYGADALAGAVNMILRKDFTGLEVNATLDQAPDVNDPGVNLAWGKKWDRGSVSLIASYEHHGDLLGTQREPTSSTSFPVNAPMSTLLLLGTDTCAPGNVYSIDGVSNLPGVSSWHAGIPAGVTGRPRKAPTSASMTRPPLDSAPRRRKSD